MMWNVAALLLGLSAQPAAAADVPPAIVRLLPRGYTVLSNASVLADRRRFIVVALGRNDEEKLTRTAGAPARPLMIFEIQGNQFRLVGRNDTVVLRADEGGQCDPFLDGDATIATKAAYFTIENGVACGAHWTDYITFRFDTAANGFVFDNERSEIWRLNSSTDPNAEALIRDGPQRVRRSPAGHPIAFAKWRPRH